VLDVHPSGFYAWLQQPHSQRHQTDLRLTGQIKQFWLESGCVYGYRKIHLDLRDTGQQCGVNRVWRLMKRAGIQGHSSSHFRYDAADNLAANDDDLPVTNNRLLHWQNLFMKYDHWGNLVSRRSGLYEQHYVYDDENQLISAQGTGPEGRFEARYHYDALGRRTRRIVTTTHGASEICFLWQGYRLLQEQLEGGHCSTYIYDPNEVWSPLARIDHLQNDNSGEIFWFSTDLNGAPLEATDANGTVRWSGHYGSFGEIRHQTEGFTRQLQNQTLSHQPLRYAGQYADSETGLHYNLFRYYDPQVGRFIVQDPIGLNGGWNLYQYAPNPLVWIDPTGLSRYPGVDFSGSDALYPHGESIVKIQMTGSRYGDFKAANDIAGYANASGNITGKSHPENYTWHHLNDYDPVSNTSTMQLVETSAHEATFPHSGSVSQFEKYNGVKYESAEAKKTAKSLNCK